MKRVLITAIVGLHLTASATGLYAQTLRGSSVAMQRQNDVAQQLDYSFLQTSAAVRRFVEAGLLQRVSENANLDLVGVSHPYARPAVKLFIERLAGQYKAACGQKLVVTSLTRPVLEQPRNASDLSVHPAGMAVDLRVSTRTSCRRWLEQTLLSLERQGVLEATREKRPPHYHVALFPTRYTNYVAQLDGPAAVRTVAASSTRATPVSAKTAAADDTQMYKVNRGDSLWSIARRLGTTVDTLKEMNNLRNSSIVAGQVLTVPVSANGAEQN
jgi:LysM repeat protein